MPHPEIPLNSGDEYDCFTRWRHYLHWKKQQRAKIKRSYNKRVRRWIKNLIKKEINE